MHFFNNTDTKLAFILSTTESFTMCCKCLGSLLDTILHFCKIITGEISHIQRPSTQSQIIERGKTINFFTMQYSKSVPELYYCIVLVQHLVDTCHHGRSYLKWKIENIPQPLLHKIYWLQTKDTELRLHFH